MKTTKYIVKVTFKPIEIVVEVDDSDDSNEHERAEAIARRDIEYNFGGKMFELKYTAKAERHYPPFAPKL